MSPSSRAEPTKLEVAEKLELIEELCDSIASQPSSAEQVSITEEEREFLDERRADYYTDPSSARPWSEIRDQLGNGE